MADISNGLTKASCFSMWFVCMSNSDTFHILTGFSKTGLSLSRISINLQLSLYDKNHHFSISLLLVKGEINFG